MNFLERGERLGHSRKLLEQGVAVNSTIVIPNVDQLRDLLYDPDDRGPHGPIVEYMFKGIPDPPHDSAEGILRRVEQFVFGTAPLDEQDRKFISEAFPLSIAADSVLDEKINYVYRFEGTVPVVKNWGTLTLENGGCLIASGVKLKVFIEKLVRTGSAPAPYKDINILGITGTTPVAAASGPTGTVGTAGTKGECSSAGIAGKGGEPGHTGGAGILGGTGDGGRDGVPSQSAEFQIRELTGDLTVFTRSGTGGAGAAGGRGGVGGVGGKGGDGVQCGCTGNRGGNGGKGGTGGNGGTGGPGGNGINAEANVIIKLPSKQIAQVKGTTAEAPFGSGGAAGAPGAGGAGGGGGSAGKHNSGGSTGPTGSQGVTGATGTGGTRGGQAAEIIVIPLT